MKINFRETEKLKVLVAAHIGYPVGGISINYENLISSDLQYKVDLFFVETSVGNLDFHERGLLSRSSISNSIINLINFTIALIKTKPDIVHIGTAFGFSLWKHACLGFISKLFNIHVVMQFHFNVKNFPHSKNVFNKLLISLLKLVDGYIVLSEDWYAIKEFFPQKEIVIIPNAIDTKNFENIQIRRANINNKPIKILFLGHIGKEKGVFDLVNTVIDIYMNHEKGIELDIYGDPLSNEDKNKVHILSSISKQYDFIKISEPRYNEEKIRIFSESDIFVLPSYHEGMPISIIEAMASGLPVVATSVGGIVDQIIDGETGFLIEPGNLIQLKSALLKLIIDEDLRFRMGFNSRERACKKFSMTRKIELLLNLYESICCKS